jgi:preprotein translocase subunit SecE
MNRFLAFLNESFDEMTNHVTWSKYSELNNSTILVLVASLIFAVLIGLTDKAFETGLDAFYKSF